MYMLPPERGSAMAISIQIPGSLPAHVFLPYDCHFHLGFFPVAIRHFVRAARPNDRMPNAAHIRHPRPHAHFCAASGRANASAVRRTTICLVFIQWLPLSLQSCYRADSNRGVSLYTWPDRQEPVFVLVKTDDDLIARHQSRRRAAIQILVQNSQNSGLQRMSRSSKCIPREVRSSSPPVHAPHPGSV